MLLDSSSDSKRSHQSFRVLSAISYTPHYKPRLRAPSRVASTWLLWLRPLSPGDASRPLKDLQAYLCTMYGDRYASLLALLAFLGSPALSPLATAKVSPIARTERLSLGQQHHPPRAATRRSRCITQKACRATRRNERRRTSRDRTTTISRD